MKMKYLKYFENNSEPKYKIGDYVEVNSEELGIKNEIGVIDFVDSTIKAYGCIFSTFRELDNILEDEIIRKLEDHEVEALKYNL